MNKVKRPKCGGYLVIEEFGHYGLSRKIGFDGKIRKKVIRKDYGGGDAIETLVYCPSCLWESDSQFEQDGDSVTLTLYDGGVSDG